MLVHLSLSLSLHVSSSAPFLHFIYTSYCFCLCLLLTPLLSFVYIQLYVEFITLFTLSRTASVGHIVCGYRQRWDFGECTCMLMWIWAGLVCVCVDRGGIPWAICIGPVHLRNCLWVCGVPTMFWTISSNKSQPKLLVSVSLAKWQTVHPPKSSLLRYKQAVRKTEGQRNRLVAQIAPPKKKYIYNKKQH